MSQPQQEAQMPPPQQETPPLHNYAPPQQEAPPPHNYAPQPHIYVPPPPFIQPKKEKRVYSAAERLLLLAALAIAILCDRLIFNIDIMETVDYLKIVSVFWLCCLGIFYGFFRRRLNHNWLSWYIAGCVIALSMWNFFFLDNTGYGDFGALCIPVTPAVLMALVVYTTGEYKLKDAGDIALAWLSGWFIKPFSGIPVFFGAIGSLFSGDNRSTAKRVMLGLVITVPLLMILLPLLSTADIVFGYYLRQILSGWNIASMTGHTVIIVIAFVLFYSFLWNMGFGAKVKAAPKVSASIDTVICGIVLGTVTLLYVVFCVVQFAYLFAGAGLPGAITYSEYAREGFAQTVVVCAINLLIYGVFLRFGTRNRITISLLIGLLALTGVMLFSGFVRLGLYIEAYGMTWLRLLSAWFMIYLAAVIIICCIRMWRRSLPAIALCAIILLGWYVVLGYTNPDGFVAWYNQKYGYEAVAAMTGIGLMQ